MYTNPGDAGGGADAAVGPCGAACPASNVCVLQMNADGGSSVVGCASWGPPSDRHLCTQTATGWTSPFCGDAATLFCLLDPYGTPLLAECGPNP
jgi:hypothetical protein